MTEKEARRPLIGICSRPGEEDPDLSYINSHYAKAIQQAGGIPVALPYGFEAAAIAPEIVDRIDGLLLTGGGDVSEGRSVRHGIPTSPASASAAACR